MISQLGRLGPPNSSRMAQYGEDWQLIEQDIPGSKHETDIFRQVESQPFYCGLR